jgi:uncharacterized protein YigE (DUF2233 family)
MSSTWAQSNWLSSDTFVGHDGKPVAVEVVSSISSERRLRVLHAAAVVGNRDIATSIKGLSTTPKMAEIHHQQRILLSAGYSSYRTDVPVGLLVSNGKVHSLIDFSPSRTNARSQCDAAAEAKYLFSGILCVPVAARGWQIVPTGQYQEGQCKEAVQSGPLLVELGGKPGICESPHGEVEEVHARMAACIDHDDKLHLVRTDPTTLYSFSQWLLHGRLKCTVALNLSGAGQAGWVRLPTVRKPMPKFYGGVDTPLASALFLEPR